MEHLTIADIEAINDVIDDLAEESDSMSVERGIEVMEALEALKSNIHTTIGLVKSQLTNVLESPREMNGKRYEIKRDGKWRPDHMKIDAEVLRAARADENGELRPAAEVAEQAVKIMRSLYVAPSSFPKQGGLEALGLDKPDVGRYEESGKRVAVTDLEVEEA